MWAGRWQIPAFQSASSSYCSLKTSFLIQRTQSQATIPLMFFLCRTTCEDRLPQETQVTSLLLHLCLHAAFFPGAATGRELGVAWGASIGGTAFHAPCLQSWKKVIEDRGFQWGSSWNTNLFSWNIFWRYSWNGRNVCVNINLTE